MKVSNRPVGVSHRFRAESDAVDTSSERTACHERDERLTRSPRGVERESSARRGAAQERTVSEG